MNDPWAEPCPESDAVFNTVHEWVSRKALKRRSRTIVMDWLDLVDTIAQEKVILPEQRVSDALTSLMDLDWVQKTNEGFLVRKFFTGTSRHPGFSGSERVSLVAERLDDEDTNNLGSPETSKASRSLGVKHESVPKYVGTPRPTGPRVELCRDFFPSLMKEHQMETIPAPMYSKALYSQVKKMQIDYKLNLSFVRQMMEEFVQHPLWCERSHRLAWQVFISRREELIKRVHAQKQKDPGNRRFSDGRGREYWLGTPTKRHNRGAEYWLGKYAQS
jgi:hypothetical protein